MEQKEFKFYVDTIKDIWKIKNTKIDKNNLSPFKKMKKILKKVSLQKIKL